MREQHTHCLAGRRIKLAFRFSCCAAIFLSVVVERWNRTWIEAGLPPWCADKRITVVSHLFRFVISFTDTDGTVGLPPLPLHLHCCQLLEKVSVFLAESGLTTSWSFCRDTQSFNLRPFRANAGRIRRFGGHQSSPVSAIEIGLCQATEPNRSRSPLYILLVLSTL